MPSNSLRTPTLAVLVNGAPLPSVIDADINANAHFAAARFRLRLAVSPVVAATLLQPGDILDIQLSAGGSTTSVLQGQADTLHIDAINQTLEIDGRDLTARLLDARTQETFSNQTASEIAQTLAGRHNLTPNVTATTTLAGRFYAAEHNRITLGQLARATTEWDLLTFLAAREGFDVFVAGQTLNFLPAATGSPSVTLTPDQCISLSLSHALTLARDIQVTVKSWNTRQQSAVSQTARSTAAGPRTGPPQKLVVVRPNLAPGDAQLLAQRILADLSAHERIVQAELPGEAMLTPRAAIQLSGTGTDFDQRYRIAELDRHFSSQHGFTQRLRLKNIPTQLT